MKRLALVIVALAACSKQAAQEQGDTYSCNDTNVGSCREWKGANLAAGVESLQTLCAISKQAVFSRRTCPTAGMTGKCTRKDATDYFYKQYPLPSDDLEPACKTAEGVFSK
ncbi:MAG TPA: hypothetical protein VGM39_06135 [Kofleriaceae bacterium]|jgi:hypothetical protein